MLLRHHHEGVLLASEVVDEAAGTVELGHLTPSGGELLLDQLVHLGVVVVVLII